MKKELVKSIKESREIELSLVNVIADENFEIHQNDCAEVMKVMVKDSIKIPLIVMDPPYEFKNTQTGGKSGLHFMIFGLSTALTGFYLFNRTSRD